MAHNLNGLMLPSWIRMLLPNGHVEELKLETYLAGAIAAEIGITAPLEALKAQAVASRTYVVAARRHAEHDADVCVTSHCQRWRRVDPVTAPEVFRALTETWGLIATYNEQLIDAFFFEHCDGKTRDAEAMLMPATPYLRGVECPCGFLTLKGHGIGVCKRGAIVMARRGASFEQILSHYYRGVVLVRIESANHVAPEREEIAPPHTVAKAKKPRKPSEPARKPERKRATRRAKPAAEPSAPQVESEPGLPQTPEPTPIIETPAPVEPEPVVVQPSASMETPVVEETPTDEWMIAPVIDATTPDEPAQEVLPLVSIEPIEIEPVLPPAPTVITENQLPALEESSIDQGVRLHVDHLPGMRMIAGCLEQPGAEIIIEDAWGNRRVVLSGSAPHYGAGGFETLVDEDGIYRVTIHAQTLEVQVSDETAFIHMH